MRSCPSCTDARFKHSCDGQCRFLRFHLNATTIPTMPPCEAESAHEPMRKLLDHLATMPPACTLSFIGDSTMHDIWAASIASALAFPHAYALVGCEFTAGRQMWHNVETDDFCGARGRDYMQPVAMAGATNVSSLYSSWATFAAVDSTGPRACRNVTLRYFEYAMVRQLLVAPSVDVLPRRTYPFASPCPGTFSPLGESPTLA